MLLFLWKRGYWINGVLWEWMGWMEGRGVGWLMKGDMGDEGVRGGVWWCVVVCGELGYVV